MRNRPSEPLIYIAGPLSGERNVDGGFEEEVRMDHVRTAIEWGDKVRAMGAAVFVPHLSHLGQILDEGKYYHTWEYWLGMDEQVILRCDMLVRIPGLSAGADREVTFCHKNDIPVTNSLEEADTWIKKWHGDVGGHQWNFQEWLDELNEDDRDVETFCRSFAAFVDACGKQSENKGFWECHKNMARQALREAGFQQQDIETAVEALHRADVVGDPAIMLALMAGEVHEAIEALRKKPANWNGKDGVWEEVSDVFIRLCDFVRRYCERHEMTPYRFAQEIHAKFQVNSKRPATHNKRY